MDVFEAVESRISCRWFLDKPVDPKLVRRLIADAARAASGGNLQPWQVYALTGAALTELKAKVAAAIADGDPRHVDAEYPIYPKTMWEPYGSRREHHGVQLYGALKINRDDAEARLTQYKRNYEFFNAPVALFIAIDRRLGPGQWADLGGYIHALMFLACGHGLDTCAQESWARMHGIVAPFVNMPPEQMLFCAVSVGYGDHAHPANSFRSPRAAAAEFCRFLGFDRAGIFGIFRSGGSFASSWRGEGTIARKAPQFAVMFANMVTPPPGPGSNATMVIARQGTRHGRASACRSAVLGGALAAAMVGAVAMPRPAAAQGLFDFLFGGFQQRPAQQENYPAPPAPGVGRVAPAPLGQESLNDSGGSTGHAVAFCVRLCDGQHFPVEQIINGTPAETCRAICPYSKTKVFVGSEIGGAVAQDGQRYNALETAFLYRKQLVANCTCNGRDAFGLTSFDVKRDPTLRPGDIVSTNEGLLAFTGRSAQGAAFTPVNPASLPSDIKSGTSPTRVPAATIDPAADDQGGTIVQRSNGLLPSTAPPAKR